MLAGLPGRTGLPEGEAAYCQASLATLTGGGGHAGLATARAAWCHADQSWAGVLNDSSSGSSTMVA